MFVLVWKPHCIRLSQLNSSYNHIIQLKEFNHPPQFQQAFLVALTKTLSSAEYTVYGSLDDDSSIYVCTNKMINIVDSSHASLMNVVFVTTLQEAIVIFTSSISLPTIIMQDCIHRFR